MFGFHGGEEGVISPGTSWGEARDAGQCTAGHRTVPCCQNVVRAEAGKAWVRPSSLYPGNAATRTFRTSLFVLVLE